MKIRDAAPNDLAMFHRLFPELGVDDPLPTAERFERELMPSTIVCDDDGDAVGYVYQQVLGELTIVRNVVTAPNARRRGVSRALMLEAEKRAIAAGSTTWALNVKQDNVAAIALYRDLGFSIVSPTSVVRLLGWPHDVRAPIVDDVTVRPFLRDEDAALESQFAMLHGGLRDQRKNAERAFIVALRNDSAVGLAVFSPVFPGAYPFHARDVDVVDAIATHLAAHHHLPEKTFLQLVIEGHEELARALVERGARLLFDLFHMRRALPRA